MILLVLFLLSASYFYPFFLFGVFCWYLALLLVQLVILLLLLVIFCWCGFCCHAAESPRFVLSLDPIFLQHSAVASRSTYCPYRGNPCRLSHPSPLFLAAGRICYNSLTALEENQVYALCARNKLCSADYDNIFVGIFQKLELLFILFKYLKKII